jgi:hypothetical protein
MSVTCCGHFLDQRQSRYVKVGVGLLCAGITVIGAVMMIASAATPTEKTSDEAVFGVGVVLLFLGFISGIVAVCYFQRRVCCDSDTYSAPPFV